jgi:hypothetical protein
MALTGTAFALCLAGPLIGAVRGLTWPHIAGGHTEAAAALRILNGEYWRRYEQGDLARPAFAVEGECQTMLGKRMTATPVPSPQETATLMKLDEAVFGAQALRKQAAHEQAKVDRLARLPYVALGSIEGCLGQSVLAPLCRAYVHHVIAGADAQVNDAAIERDMEPLWCAVARAPV